MNKSLVSFNKIEKTNKSPLINLAWWYKPSLIQKKSI